MICCSSLSVQFHLYRTITSSVLCIQKFHRYKIIFCHKKRLICQKWRTILNVVPLSKDAFFRTRQTLYSQTWPIGLAYIGPASFLFPFPFHRMPRGSCRDFTGTKAAFAVRMEALIPWRTVSGAAIIRAILHVASNTARILFTDPWLLICQIIHIHEKDALVSDLGARMDVGARAYGMYRVSRETTRLN